MAAIIRDNGRGPEIVGTDVTVFDVMDGVRAGFAIGLIATMFGVWDDDIEAAIRYFEEHRAAIEPEYQRIRAGRASDFPRLDHALAEIRRKSFENWNASRRAPSPDGKYPAWPEFEKPFVFDRGRGPEIIGRRITVFDIMDYWKHRWPVKAIAWLFKLTVEQVEVGIAYVEGHLEELRPEYEAMVERSARGNPPEIQAKLDACAGAARAALERFRQGKPLREAPHAEPSGRP